MNIDSYWDESGLLKARKYERDGNMLSRTAYYHLFCNDEYRKNRIELDGIFSLGKMFSNGNWAQHVYTDYRKDRASHDEISAAFYFASIGDGRNDYYIRKTKCWKYILYPQVFFFLLACKYKWRWAVILAYVQMYLTTLEKKKAKNGKWDTDGALLSLLKIMTINNLRIRFPRWKLIFENIRVHWGDNFDSGLSYQKNLISEMLGDEIGHPLVVMFKENL